MTCPHCGNDIELTGLQCSASAEPEVQQTQATIPAWLVEEVWNCY